MSLVNIDWSLEHEKFVSAVVLCAKGFRLLGEAARAANIRIRPRARRTRPRNYRARSKK